MTELMYCAWLVPPFWLWIFARRDKEKAESIGVEIGACGVAAIILMFCTFCVIHAITLAWGPHT